MEVRLMKLDEMTLDIEQHVEVKADIGDVFKGVLHALAKAAPTLTESRCK
jgi:hypothetical protein